MRFYIPTLLTYARLFQTNGFAIKPTVVPIVPVLDKQNDPKVSVVILPGTLVRPKYYEPIAHSIERLCNSKKIEVDVSLAKFTLNIGHRFQVESMSEEILKTVKTDNIVLVGHSASAFVGIDISSKVKAKGLVQWCGTFNSRGSFPWEIRQRNELNSPVLCILAEQDGMLSFTSALKDFDGLFNSTTTFPTYIKDAKHMSGISWLDRPLTKRMRIDMINRSLTEKELGESYAKSIAMRISDFVGYVNGSDVSRVSLNLLKEDFWIKYEGLIHANHRPSVKSMIYRSDSFSKTHTHIHTPQGMFLTVVYCSFPESRYLIHFLTMMLPFIFSHDSVSICPLMNVLPGKKLNNPSIWVKIPKHTRRKFSRDTNSKTFKAALEEVPERCKQEYFQCGKPMVFGSDIDIPLVPGCALVWLMSPLKIAYGNKEDPVVVSSPTIRMGSRLNTKLISREQCLEWILVKAFN